MRVFLFKRIDINMLLNAATKVVSPYDMAQLLRKMNVIAQKKSRFNQ